MFAASFREPRSQPFVRMTPPMSQKSVVISAKGVAPPNFAFIFQPYHLMNENAKRAEIYGATVQLFPSTLSRMDSSCSRPDSAQRVRCNRITGHCRGPRDSRHATRNFGEFAVR